jgi:hypothetical protein
MTSRLPRTKSTGHCTVPEKTKSLLALRSLWSTPGASRRSRARLSPYIHMPGFGFAPRGTCAACPQMVCMSNALKSLRCAASRNGAVTFIG